MQSVSNSKIGRFLPHHWLGLKGLSALYTILFYATLAVGLYAAACWIDTFFHPAAELAVNSAPLRRIYGFATVQALLVCILWAFLQTLCRSLWTASAKFQSPSARK